MPSLLQVSSEANVSLFWVLLAAVLAPVITRLTRKLIPQVVCLLGLGVLIGPSMLGLGDPHGLEMLKQLGLGLLFLSAGYEIDPGELQGRQFRKATITWSVSLALAIGLALIVLRDQPWLSAVALAIALSSTALGTLLPILRENGLLDSALGRAVLAHGTVGELGPVAAMALVLSGNGPWIGGLLLIGFGLLTVFLAWFTRRHARRVAERMVTAAVAREQPDIERFREWFVHTGQHQLTQGLLRLIMLLLTGLMALASLFDIDVALGAFMAGLCLRLIVGKDTEPLDRRIGVLANSFFIPVFFVTSGMAIDLAEVGAHLWIMFAALGIVLLTRGLPVWLAERFTDTGSGLTTSSQRLQLALYASAGLPIIVAVTEIAIGQQIMSQALGSCLVAAGALSVLIFPLVAKRLGQPTARQRKASG
ncbi:Kef-type K+ transport system, membrane component KefB [Propionibacterium cyclohexanicum]|uniref:Kef-type K+ transport system, membrane component KefB n=1 Tax=Propionibacterium cyclohexanicum TaxID=64702 RepID=A0A1H9SM56_9ACTN|nr:cation:proton antiporter [Propionibacterium cyclohexanicum]SER85805.1 Kef-type K+ transport system, membrane component KefB [Propionibacterium cyclohexanicum]